MAFEGKHLVTASTFELRFLFHMCVTMLSERSRCAKALTTDITTNLSMVANKVCIKLFQCTCMNIAGTAFEGSQIFCPSYANMFCFKNSIVGLVSSVLSIAALLIALFLGILSGNKLCVASGNSATLVPGLVFVASGSGDNGGGNGGGGPSDPPVLLVCCLGASFASGNADDAPRFLALLSSISFCIAIRDGVGWLLLSRGGGGLRTGSKSLSCPLSFTPCSV